MILLVDNFDSFAHNLGRYLTLLGQTVQVVRNNAISADQVESMRPRALVLSPGPGTPRAAGCCISLVQRFENKLPILGVCLGHQAIVEALGGRIVRSERPVHGRASVIEHDGRGVFADIPNPTLVGRYHSLIASHKVPASLHVSARTGDGVIMAVQHVARPVIGLQFHPESILTDNGLAILANFLDIAGLDVDRHETEHDRSQGTGPSSQWTVSGRPVTF